MERTKRLGVLRIGRGQGASLVHQAEDVLVRLDCWEAESPGNPFIQSLIKDQEELVSYLRRISGIPTPAQRSARLEQRAA